MTRSVQDSSVALRIHEDRLAYRPSAAVLKRPHVVGLNTTLRKREYLERAPVAAAPEHSPEEHRDHLTNRVGCWLCAYWKEDNRAGRECSPT